ncbi:amino acid adenylation domain-containing protein [Streptomyces sp. NPDC048483]|uniref:non-ribosomal peptide synthetase n=1 Tax=Streptomyces sp. NPDC048483 TaxID=3154927 RepID=UPI003413BF51
MTTGTEFVLSPQQRRTWLAQHTAEGAPWRWACDIEIRGAVDASRLRQAIAGLVERHEILRTTYRRIASLDAPVQVIAASWPVELDAAADRPEPRDVQGIEQPLRASLTEQADGSHLLRLQGPGPSLDVLGITQVADEIARRYADGDIAAKDEDVPQYADIAEWLNELLHAEDTAAGRDYWRRLAAGPGVPVTPPFLGRDDAGDRRTFQGVRLPVAANRISTLDDPRSLLLAAWSILLYRYGRQEESLLAVAHPGRRHPALENAIGAFTRYVPVALALRADTTVEEAIRRVAEADEEAARYQDYFTREMWAEYRQGSPAEFAVGFDYHSLPTPVAGNGCTFAVRHIEDSTDLFDIRLRCLRTEDGVEAYVEYDAGRVLPEDASGLVAALDVVLGEMAADPGHPIGELRLTAGTRSDRPSRSAPGTARSRIADRFAEMARSRPATIAVEHGTERYTYGELDRWAADTAGELGRLGAGPGTVVAILLDRGPATVAAILGCLRAGAAYTVVGTDLPTDRIRFLIDDSSAGVVLTDAHWLSRVPVRLPTVVLRPDGCELGGTPADRPRTAVPADTAYLMYTSGTTGTPKGVQVGHRNLAGYVDGLVAALQLDSPLTYCHVSSFAADLGNSVLFPALCTGGRLIIATRGETTDADRLGRRMREAAVDVVKIVPSHLRALLQASRSPADLVPRRYLITGGESLDRDLLDRIRESSETCQVVNHYGPTETTVGATYYRVPPGPLDARLATVPIGRPFDGAAVHVVDRAMQEVPAWVPGEVLIGGTGVAYGYHNGPGSTAERFWPDPFGPAAGERLYRTGDVARRLPSGDIQFIGREDGQVKVAGYRVELGEIEAVTAESAGVRQCIAVLDSRGDQAGIVVYVTPGDEPLNVDDVRDLLAARLPAYLQPSAIVPLDRFPLTANGKVDRAALPAPVIGTGTTGAEPANEAERTLLRIWREVLGHPTIGVNDDFFRSGGNSLLAIRLMSVIEKETGVNLPLSALLEANTVEQLATRMPSPSGTAPRPEHPAADSTTPFFCVHAGGGGVLAYAELVRAMAPEHTLVGIEAVGLRPGGTMQTDLREMARTYAAEIRERQPVGPYLIGGWCLGGFIAHEVAQQLARQGETVAALVVLDSSAPPRTALDEQAGTGTDSGTDDHTDEDLELLIRFAWHYQLELDDTKLPAMSGEERFAHILERARLAGVLPTDAGSERFEQLLAVYRNNMRAADAYAGSGQLPEVAQFPVLLVRAEEDPIWPELDETLGWSGLYGDQVDVVTAPGDHHTMLSPDRSEKLAKQLTGYLDHTINRPKGNQR